MYIYENHVTGKLYVTKQELFYEDLFCPPEKYESPISTKTEVEKLKKFAREQKHWNIHILKNGNLIIQYDNYKNEIYIIEIVYKTVIKHKNFI